MSKQTSITNRIWLKNNPWPNGHGLEKVRFYATLSGDGIHLHLELKSEKYYAAEGWENIHEIAEAHDFKLEEQNEEDEWLYYACWLNYHACHLQPNKKVVLGNAEQPFSMDQLNGLQLILDDPPPIEKNWGGIDFDNLYFHCYVLGHDAVGHHHIKIQATSQSNHFDIDWTGKIALAYIGEEEFRYDFTIQIRNIPFEGFDGQHRMELVQKGGDYGPWKDLRKGRPLNAREKELRDWIDQYSRIPQRALKFTENGQSDWLVFH